MKGDQQLLHKERIAHCFLVQQLSKRCGFFISALEAVTYHLLNVTRIQLFDFYNRKQLLVL